MAKRNWREVAIERLRWWLKVMGVLFALLAILGITYGIWNRLASQALEKELAKLKQSGLPVTPEELAEAAHKEKIRSRDNAAHYYEAAFHLSRVMRVDWDALRPVHFSGFIGLVQLIEHPKLWPEQRAEQILKTLQKAAPILDHARRAAEMENCRFEVKYEQLWEGRGRHVYRIWRLQELVLTQALLALWEGDARQALEACRAGLRMSHALHEDWLLVSVDQRTCPLVSSVTNCLHAAASSLSLPADICLQLSEDLKREEQELPEQSRRALQAERVFWLAYFQDLIVEPERQYFLHRGEGSWPNRPHPAFEWMKAGILASWLGRPIVRHDAAKYLRRMRQFEEIVSKPFSEAIQETLELEKRLRELPESYDGRYMFRSAHPGYFLGVGAAVARCRLARVGLAAELYRQRAGEYPESLEALVPEFLESVPEDPFTGAQLQYQRTEEGMVLYSVGQNGEDEGGAEPPPEDWKGWQPKDDITWRIER